jgi:hypothetical protein
MRQNRTCISQWNRFPIRQVGTEHPFKSPHKSLNKCSGPRSMTVRRLQEQTTCASWTRLRVSWCGRPLWREDGSVIYSYNCFWALPEHSLSGPSPAELTTIFSPSLTRGWVCNLILQLLQRLARAPTLRSKSRRNHDQIFALSDERMGL